ncbi:hypothetical protein Lalb_Chr08g0246421 [Lupinus albus]|uniref:Uncharacterized protein n=1 Tax=Lupinus albus TaxID=3870 RepID=A0A6A4Q7Y1_LUPAL|nr:hypothetical protein Lalb_Chr08g0246421 [Lupinus albus]
MMVRGRKMIAVVYGAQGEGCIIFYGCIWRRLLFGAYHQTCQVRTLGT